MKKIIILVLISLAIISCEKTLTGYDLPYERKLVIQGILEASPESPEAIIHVTLTQPPLGKSVSEIIDTSRISVYLESEGERWDFKYKNNNQSGGLILDGYFAEGFEPEAGRTYNLFVNYEDLKATASTTIPEKPEIIESYIKEIENDDGWETWTSEALFSKIKAVENVVYSQDYEWWSDPMTIKNADTDGIIDFFVDWAYIMNPDIPFYFGRFYTYDYDFYDYVLSKKQSDDDGFDLFSTSGNNIKWNIKGDGIGIFLGRYETHLKIEVK